MDWGSGNPLSRPGVKKAPDPGTLVPIRFKIVAIFTHKKICRKLPIDVNKMCF
jgi:hypothetical protein